MITLATYDPCLLSVYHNSSVFEYYGVGPGWFRAGHVEDVQYVYGTGFITELLESQPATLEDKQLSVEVMTFWTNFATSGYVLKTTVNLLSRYMNDLWNCFLIFVI